MRLSFLFISALLISLASADIRAQTPTFTFECFCGTLLPADTTCDICNSTTQSRYFKGLLIRKNGVAFKWIEEPYTVIQNFDALTFRELIPNAEQIRIDLIGTQWTTIEGFRDSVQCPCAGGGGTTLIAGPGISIWNDTIAVIPQQVDTLDLVTGAQDTIRLSLTRDSVPFHFVILPPDSDNQYIDTLRFTGTVLEISLFGDNQPLKTVDLASLVADGSETFVFGQNGILVTGTGTSVDPYLVAPPAGTDMQTLRYNGTTLVANSYLTNDGTAIGINSAPNATYRAFLKQSSTADGLAIQRSSSGNLLLYHGSAGVMQTDVWNMELRSAGQMSLFGPGGSSQITQIFFSAQSNITTASGNAGLTRWGSTYAPTTAGGDFAFMKFLPTINLTSSANQAVYLADFNPTITNLNTGTLTGIRYVPSVGSFFISQPNGTSLPSHFAGNIGIGSGTTVPAAKIQAVGNGATSSTYTLIATNSGAVTSTAALVVRDDSRVGVGTNTPARAFHVEGEARISDLVTDPPTQVVGADGDGDLSVLALSGLTVTGGTLTVTADGDGSATNEGVLGVAAGGANDALLTSNTSGANGVTYNGGSGITISESTSANGGSITITADDNSATNEIQSFTASGAGPSYDLNVSPTGGVVTLEPGAGIFLNRTGQTINIQADDDSATNEAWTIDADDADTELIVAQTVKFQGAGGVTTDYNPATDVLTIDGTSAGGNGIYGDGTAGSGDDALPPGGSNVSIPNPDSPLDIIVDASAGDVFYALRVITDYCSDDAFTKYFVGKSPSDSLEIYNFDCGAVIKETGGQLTIETNEEMLFLADSFNMATIPTRTVLPFIIGQTSTGWLQKIEGSTTGQTLVWDDPNGWWELGSAGGGTVTGTGTANRLAYWTSTTAIAADDDATFDGSSMGIGTTTLTGKLNVNAGSATAPLHLNAYGAATGTSHTVGQMANTNTAGSALFSLNEEANANTLRAGIRRFGSTHATRARELNITTFESSAPVTIGTNDVVRMTVGSDANVYVANNFAGGFGTTVTGAHSNIQSAGSMAAGYLETVGSPTFDATKHTVIYTGSTNVTWTLPTASTCTGRWYVLHHANTAGTITLSATITKGNGGNFNTLTAGQWAWIVSTGSGWRGYKIASL